MDFDTDKLESRPVSILKKEGEVAEEVLYFATSSRELRANHRVQ
jgi:hypothetical protein